MYSSFNAKNYILKSASWYQEKSRLLGLAAKNSVYIRKRDTREIIVQKLDAAIGFRKIAKELNIGISSFEIQREFQITNNEVRKLSREGLIRPIGKMKIKAHPYNYEVNIYDVFDCFRLTPEKVTLCLLQHTKKDERAV